MFSQLAKRFTDHCETRHENKPQTVKFYAEKLTKLVRYKGIGDARIDRIDEAVIEGYVVARRKTVVGATVNRELATLRRMLRLAHEWGELQRVPKICLLSGERTRDFVLSKRKQLFPGEFVLHALRHTMLTRLGESGVDAFTIMKIAGHSSIIVSQRYVHPTPEAVECAFESPQRGNQRAVTSADNSGTSEQVPTTLFATSDDTISLSN